MNYADIKQYDIANGPGVRISLFVSGCTHHCKGCFNQEAWDFNYGTLFSSGTIKTILEYMKPDYIRGLTLLGGEPFEHTNQFGLLPLVRAVKERYPNKSIWCYTGYTYETDLLKWETEGDETICRLLELIDVLVDGEFVEEKKNLRLAFRGSENQRLIDMKKTRVGGRVVCLEKP